MYPNFQANTHDGPPGRLYLRQAQREQAETYYILAVLSFFFVLAIVFIIINLPQITVFLMITIGPSSIMGSLKMLKVLKRKGNQISQHPSEPEIFLP